MRLLFVLALLTHFSTVLHASRVIDPADLEVERIMCKIPSIANEGLFPDNKRFFANDIEVIDQEPFKEPVLTAGRLDCSHRGICHLINFEFYKSLFRMITVLDLSHNKLRNIPREIVGLKFLGQLNLSHNKIGAYPFGSQESVNFPNFLKLVYLDLSYNRITSLPFLQQYPHSIQRLSNLEALNLSYNALPIIPASVLGLPKLTTLDVSGNFIRAIPQDVACCYGLKFLSLRCNEITIIPPFIEYMTSLEMLDIKCNPLKNKTIKNLTIQFFI